MRKTTLKTILISVGLVIASWQAAGARYFQNQLLEPIQIGSPFRLPFETVDGRKAGIPPSCTRVFIIDVFCSGSLSAARDWVERPEDQEVWLVVNTREQAVAYRNWFFDSPPQLFRPSGVGRLTADDITAGLGLETAPMTIVVDSTGIVRDVVIGVSESPYCRDGVGDVD